MATRCITSGWSAGQGASDIPLPDKEMVTGDVAFSPDGNFLITGEEGAYNCYSTGDCKPVHRLERFHSMWKGFIAFSPDGKLLAFNGPDNSTLLVDPSTGQEIATLDTQIPHIARAMAFSRDSNRLAVTSNGSSVMIWDVRAIKRELSEINLTW